VADRSLFYAASPEDASRIARSGRLSGSSAEVEVSVQRVASPGGAAVAVRVPAELVRPSDQPDRVFVERAVVTPDRVGRAFQPWHADVQPDVGQRWKGYLQPEMTLTLRNLVGADTPLPLRQREDDLGPAGMDVRSGPGRGVPPGLDGHFMPTTQLAMAGAAMLDGSTQLFATITLDVVFDVDEVVVASPDVADALTRSHGQLRARPDHHRHGAGPVPTRVPAAGLQRSTRSSAGPDQHLPRDGRVRPAPRHPR